MGVNANLLSALNSFTADSVLGRWLTAQNAAKPDPAAGTNGSAIDEIQSIAQDGTDHTGGSFKLAVTLGTGELIETAAIAYNANAATIEAAIDAAADGQDEVQSIAQDATDHTGGTFALAVTVTTSVGQSESFTTAAIAYNANAATVETALDVAATAAGITGWVNGAISVSGGILQAAGAAMVFTFDGAAVDDMPHELITFDGALLTGGTEPATRVTRTTPGSVVISGFTASDISVSGGILQAAGATVVLTFDGTKVTGLNHSLVTFDGALLTGGAEPATRVTKTVAGATARPAWDALLAYDIISGSIPAQDAAVTTVTRGNNLTNVPSLVQLAMAKEATYEDGNQASYYTIVNSIFPNDRAPQVEQINAATA